MLTDPGYFYNPIKRDIVMIKGDTMSFGFQVQGLGATAPDFIQFTCKETVEDDDPLFAVSLDTTIDIRSYDAETDTYTFTVRVPPIATANIEVGRYFYDLELRANGDIITLMNGRLSIEAQVTIGGITPPPSDGDSIAYPITIEDPTIKKIYTEKSINDIAEQINFIYDINDSYTVNDMSTVIGAIGSDISDIVTAINTITGSSEQISIDDIAQEITDELGLKYESGEEVYY